MKEINESGYALFKRLGNLSDAHITEASVCPERKGLPAFWKSFAGIAGLAAALALVLGLTLLVSPPKIDPHAGSETAESESENAPGTWSGETEPDPEEEYACWFLYRGHKAVTETGLWCISEYFDDPDKPGLDGDGPGLSFKLTEMEDAPTIWYDIDGTDKITYYEAGVETEKAFRLWDSDGFSTLDFGTDLYAYLKEHPGAYYLSCDRHVERKIDGGTKTAEYCEGVRLIAGDGVPETAPETEPETELKTDLEFRIAENVNDFDFSGWQERYGIMGGREYYGSGYVPMTDENGEQIDPEECVIYTITSYPDYSDKEQHITRITITDPAVRIFGLCTASSLEEFDALFESMGYKIENVGSAGLCHDAVKGNISYSYGNGSISISVEVTNRRGLVF